MEFEPPSWYHTIQGGGMHDKLEVNIWASADELWHGEVLEWSDSPTEGTEYISVYETRSDSYGKVMVNIALSLIRNSVEEME